MRLAILLLIASCSSSAPREPRVHPVEIRGMQFVPAALVVAPGDVIEWTNHDVVPHTATAVGVFDSAVIAATGSWRYTAAGEGVIPYLCTMHPTMRGTITIR